MTSAPKSPGPAGAKPDESRAQGHRSPAANDPRPRANPAAWRERVRDDDTPKVVEVRLRVDSSTGKVWIEPPADTNIPASAIRNLHELELDAIPYYRQIVARGPCGEEHYADRYVEQYLAEMVPSNPAERMLAVQMLWQHARIGHLVRVVSRQTGLDSIKVLNDAIDSAVNTQRRLTMAWNGLKNPRPTQFVKAGQVNMAGQQVVSNGPMGVPPSAPTTQSPPDRMATSTPAPPNESREASPKPVSANEQGFDHAQKTTPSLPPVIPGLDCPPGVRGPRETVDAVYRPQDGRRQGALKPELAQARAANSKRHRT